MDPVLQGGAFYDSKVKEWVDYIFEKDPQSPGTILVHAEHLRVPEGLENYSTPDEARLRAEVYSLDALLNAYRMRQLCTVDNLLTSSESVLHAHAELFLSKGYAAWNLSGQSRLAYEERLKRFSDPTITTLFSGTAPVCTVGGNEVLLGSDLQERVMELERENANFKAISEEGAEEMGRLRDELLEKNRQIELMEMNLKGAIDAALKAKHKELEELRNSTDLIVASALQEQKDLFKRNERISPLYGGTNQECTSDSASETLKAYVKNLEKRQKQLEEYLLLAKDALEEKKVPTRSEVEDSSFNTRVRAAKSEDYSNMFEEEIHRKRKYTLGDDKKSCSIQ